MHLECFLGMPSALWTFEELQMQQLQNLRNCVDSDRLKWYETHLQPLAAKAWESKFLWTKRVQPKLWEVQYQVFDLRGALNEEHLGLSISGTRQAFLSATQMCPRSYFFSFWMISCHTEAYSEMVNCSFTTEFRDKTTHVKINKSTKKVLVH